MRYLQNHIAHQASLIFLALTAAQGHAALGPLIISNDATTSTYQFTYSNSAITERQIYLDTDQKASTGYTIGGLGAEYLLVNGTLYKYTGTGGYHWSWKAQRQVSYTDTGKLAKWIVARSELGWPAGIRLIGKVTLPVEVTLAVTQAWQTQIASLGRDPYKWPFASNSIWNTPIGTGAVYVAANLPAVPGNNEWAPMPQLDLERIVMRPEALKTNVAYNGAGWTGADRCPPSNTVLAALPIPNEYVLPSSMYNNGAAFIEPDGRTLIQTQPLARCNYGGTATALGIFPPADLYGDGMYGAHGGSYLSTLGGTLRLGELRPGGAPPRHALKLDVDPAEVLFPCQTHPECYRWPAKTADSAAIGLYGSENPHPNPALKMGSLLAIPASVDLTTLGLETEAGRQLAWTMQNFGIYIVDSTGGAAYAISVEDGPDGSFGQQFEADWGFPMEQRVRNNSPWSRDFQRLIVALQVVNNNGPTSVGGGGTPLQDPAPPLP